MKKKHLRPATSLLIVGATLSAIYFGTWKYDPARLEPRAMKGNPEAQYHLGKAYFDGYLVGKNNRTAATWLTKAAEQGHLKAQAGLALMYAKGLGVRQDYAEAIKWYREAADQGWVPAQNQLGVLYAQGKGARRDFDEAIKWFSRAAEQGCKTARQNLTLTLAARSGGTVRIEAKGRVYSAVTVVKVETDGLTVAFEPEPGGIGFAKIRFSDLPADLQKQYACDSQRYSANEAGLTRLTSLPVQSL